MRAKSLRIVIVASIAVVTTALAWVPTSEGSVVGACAWASLERDGTTNTIKKDTDDNSCPTTPPPDPDDACPGTPNEVHHKQDVGQDSSVEVLVCVMNP